ncbi:MAG: hypothetical protein ABSC48_07345 [Terracidiphilus sp.]|jgi:hypothetical protein
MICGPATSAEPAEILRGAEAAARSLTKFRVRRFKFGEEFARGTKPSGSCVFETLADAFSRVRLCGIIAQLFYRLAEGTCIDLTQDALFFTKAIQSGTVVVKWRTIPSTH